MTYASTFAGVLPAIVEDTADVSANANSIPALAPRTDLVERFARTGNGRDWLHAFARNRVGRYLVPAHGAILLVCTGLVWVGVVDTAGNPRRGVVAGVVSLIHVAACWLSWRFGLMEPAKAKCGARVGDHSWMSRLLLSAMILLSALVLVVDFSGRNAPVADFNQPVHYAVVITTVMFTTAVFASIVSLQLIGVAPLLITVFLALGQHIAGMPARWDLWIIAFMVAYIMALTLRLTNWHEKLWEQWEAELDALAQLAATEERLAIARDIHDVTGQTLTAIAFKAELAVGFFERGDVSAVSEAKAVCRLAREALNETRELASGYRQTDLQSELVGARTLIEAIGARVDITGSTAGWPEEVLAVFGWVIREAATNVARHSKATRASIEFTEDGGWAELRMTNNGVGKARAAHAAERRSGGSGLPGLRERLSAVGGTLTTTRDKTLFTITAKAPLTVNLLGKRGSA